MKFDSLTKKVLGEGLLHEDVYLLLFREPHEFSVVLGVYDSKEAALKGYRDYMSHSPEDQEYLSIVSVPLNPSEPSHRYSEGTEVDVSYEGWDLDDETKDSWRGAANNL